MTITLTQADRILAFPVPGHDMSVRDYLVHLLIDTFKGEATEKYGWTGQSDWRFDLYSALVLGGAIPPYDEGYGPDASADRMIYAAISRLGRS